MFCLVLSWKLKNLNHGSVTYTVVNETFGSKSYTMTAEVGVLTRNIKIIGEYHPNLYSQSYGARVVVGAQTEVDETTMQLRLHRGSLKINIFYVW